MRTVGFSLIDTVLEDLEHRVSEARLMAPAEPWSPEERTPALRRARVSRALADFREFDRTYFPPEAYVDGYYEPNEMLVDIPVFMQTPGVHIILGPRKHGKTVTAKKTMVWLILRGDLRIGGTYSQTLPTARNILADVVTFLRDNPRIVSDFGVRMLEDNDDQCAIRAKTFRHTAHLRAFSEERSVRGYARGLDRPQLILGDDIETNSSPLGEQHVVDRVKRISEAYRSLGDNGTFIWLGNNFDQRCATNSLKGDAERGWLPARWYVHVYQAWRANGPLWAARFPALTEEELKGMLGVSSEADYQGNDQQCPIPDEGITFLRRHYAEWFHIPADARGVVICDPNLSLKGKGDTTAIIHLLYSPSADWYFVQQIVCHSIADSNDLLDLVLEMRDPDRTLAIFFDGNVAQESNWTNNVRNWSRLNNRPFPRIVYHRYDVTTLVKSAQLIWASGRIALPPGCDRDPEGRVALAQLFAFAGKKQAGKDDFPDGLICGLEALNRLGFARPQQEEQRPITVVQTVFDFHPY